MTKVFFKNLELEVLDSVYEPAEDSFLLAEQISKENLQGKKVLDLCTGSGIQAVVAALQGAEVIAVDINSKACENVVLNAEKLGVEEKIEVVECDLFENINGKFDLISFNPPYLPADEVRDIRIEAEEDGRATINRFLDEVSGYLTEDGKALMVQSSLNNLNKTLKNAEKNGLKAVVIGREKVFFEEILLIELKKKDN